MISFRYTRIERRNSFTQTTTERKKHLHIIDTIKRIIKRANATVCLLLAFM